MIERLKKWVEDFPCPTLLGGSFGIVIAVACLLIFNLLSGFPNVPEDAPAAAPIFKIEHPVVLLCPHCGNVFMSINMVPVGTLSGPCGHCRKQVVAEYADLAYVKVERKREKGQSDGD